jgi:hypothetical protein
LDNFRALIKIEILFELHEDISAQKNVGYGNDGNPIAGIPHESERNGITVRMGVT